MTHKNTAASFFVLGLLVGMIVAFASCSRDEPEVLPPPSPIHYAMRVI